MPIEHCSCGRVAEHPCAKCSNPICDNCDNKYCWMCKRCYIKMENIRLKNIQDIPENSKNLQFVRDWGHTIEIE